MSYQILARGISIDRLQSFCRVVEAGSIAAAADGDPNRQSLYSRQIRQLEEALEKVLFVRAGRSMTLSEEGRRLAVMTNAYFAELETFAFGEDAALLRIGAGESILETIVYPRFRELRAVLPGRRFEFVSLSTNGIVESLETGGIEYGLVREDAGRPGWEFRAIGALEFEMVVPRSLLPGGQISMLSDLRNLPIATLGGQGRFLRLLDGVFRKESLTVQVVARADSFAKVVALARTGAVAAVVPTRLASVFSSESFVRYSTPSFAELRRPIVLAISATAKNLRPSVGRDFQILSEALSS